MKNAVNAPVDPTATSFQHMKSLVDSSLGKAVPTAGELLASQDKPLFFFDQGDTTITVYMNGFCLCQNNDGDKVFAVDRCKAIVLDTSDNEVISIEEQRFSSGPCLIPLLVMGCTARRFNTEDFTDLWRLFSERNRKP